jgi:hypothetical protein
MPTRRTKTISSTSRRRRRNDEEEVMSEESSDDAEQRAAPHSDSEEEEDFPNNRNASVNTSHISHHDDRETSNLIHEHHQQEESNLHVEDPDQDTLRIMLSTDNHLGYAENDTVRGNDSFAALEEVLYLAKFYRCDLVLLAGDLFHDNRPTRRTLYKASE